MHRTETWKLEIRKILLNSHGDEKKKTLEDSELLLKMIY